MGRAEAFYENGGTRIDVTVNSPCLDAAPFIVCQLTGNLADYSYFGPGHDTIFYDGSIPLLEMECRCTTTGTFVPR